MALTWPDVGRTLRVEHGLNPDGSLKDTKTRARRSVPVVAALAADLKAARPKGAAGPIFPRSDGAHWRTGDLRNWRNRKWKPAVKAAKVDIGRPYDLRHSAASLWLREGVDVATVSQRLGHAPAELLGTYAHVIAELDPTDRRPAADLIAAARA